MADETEPPNGLPNNTDITSTTVVVILPEEAEDTRQYREQHPTHRHLRRIK